MMLKKKKGFTLIELLVCLVIIGMMMLLIIPNISKQREIAHQKTHAAIIKVIDTQKELYKLEFPAVKDPTLDQLKEGKYITQEQYDEYTAVNKEK